MPRTSRRPIQWCAPAQNHNLDRLEHDEQVETNGSIVDVEEIVLQLLCGVLERVAILIADLSPASDSWNYNIAYRVVRNLFGEPLDEFRTLRPWANKSHIALQHAPELRNFIQPRTAQEVAHTRDARIIICSPGRSLIGFCVLPHGAELI